MMRQDMAASSVVANPSSITVGETLRRILDLIREDELAEVLSLSTETLAQWRKDGAGPDFARLGKRIWYRRQDVESWIKVNVVPTKRTAAAA